MLCDLTCPPGAMRNRRLGCHPVTGEPRIKGQSAQVTHGSEGWNKEPLSGIRGSPWGGQFTGFRMADAMVITAIV